MRQWHGDVRQWHGEKMAQWGEAMAQWGEAMAQWGEAMAQCGESMAQWVASMAQCGESMAQWGEAMTQWGEAMAQWGGHLIRRVYPKTNILAGKLGGRLIRPVALYAGKYGNHNHNHSWFSMGGGSYLSQHCIYSTRPKMHNCTFEQLGLFILLAAYSELFKNSTVFSSV